MQVQGNSSIRAGYPPSLRLNLSCNSREVILTAEGFALMASLLDQICRQIERCISGQTSLDEFRAWFVPISWNIEDCGEPDTIQLAFRIDGILSEASSGQWTDHDIVEELAGIVALLRS
jgi:hypothetical protein